MSKQIPSTRFVTFTPGLVPSLAALVALIATLYLGFWQQDRAQQKRLLQASFDARALLPTLALSDRPVQIEDAYRRARANGNFELNGQFFVDNKSEGVVVGYHVFAPFRLAPGERLVLVNRGFVPRGPAYPAPPVVPVPVGNMEVTGLLVELSSKFLELGNQSPVQGTVWQNLTIERYQRLSARQVEPLVLLANPTAIGLTPIVERPDAKVEKHVEYMLTWFSLAFTIVALWVGLNLHFPRRQAPK
jgi:surfeit locus 1 family protein